MSYLRLWTLFKLFWVNICINSPPIEKTKDLECKYEKGQGQGTDVPKEKTADGQSASEGGSLRLCDQFCAPPQPHQENEPNRFPLPVILQLRSDLPLWSKQFYNKPGPGFSIRWAGLDAALLWTCSRFLEEKPVGSQTKLKKWFTEYYRWPGIADFICKIEKGEKEKRDKPKSEGHLSLEKLGYVDSPTITSVLLTCSPAEWAFDIYQDLCRKAMVRTNNISMEKPAPACSVFIAKSVRQTQTKEAVEKCGCCPRNQRVSWKLQLGVKSSEYLACNYQNFSTRGISELMSTSNPVYLEPNSKLSFNLEEHTQAGWMQACVSGFREQTQAVVGYIQCVTGPAEELYSGFHIDVWLQGSRSDALDEPGLGTARWRRVQGLGSIGDRFRLMFILADVVFLYQSAFVLSAAFHISLQMLGVICVRKEDRIRPSLDSISVGSDTALQVKIGALTQMMRNGKEPVFGPKQEPLKKVPLYQKHPGALWEFFEQAKPGKHSETHTEDVLGES
ncbi:hypothetical protein MG293_015148 [Ovis ammon polii]|uniref:Uncharacterized protein n=1 Tax=Ovis ammon polii TaxID=230172 RepID=A0AAD4TTS8_OVIAM|nr:hypothetical protein MG293_015148 [Ovis ammon polii]